MKNKICRSLSLLLCASLLAGCGSLSSATKGKEYISSDHAASAADTSSSGSTSAATATTTADTAAVEPSIASSASSTASSVSSMADDALNIVFLGDSQFDNARDTGTSIPELVGQMTSANVYNLGCGGTSASLSKEQKNISWDQWSSPNFTGVVWALAGKVSPKIFDGYAAANVFPQVDPSKVDYYVIEYGVNDYLNGTQIYNQDDSNDKSTYVSSLQIGIDNLKQISPNAKIVVSSPAYALFYNAKGVYIGDGNIVDKGAGTLSKYASSAGNVASTSGCLYLDAYYGTVFDLNGNTTDDFLQDGIHFTEKGRRVYATALSHIINKDLGKDTSEPGVLQIENF